MGKAFEKQIKTIEDQGQKQVHTLKDLKPKDKKEKEIQANEDKSDDHDDKLAKVNLLQAFNVIHDFDMICLSESYLDLSASSDNDKLYIRDYKLLRADHPGNIKRGGVCVYFKESLPVTCLPKKYSKKCLIFQVSNNNKRGYVFSMYRSPSQTSDDFNSFTTNLDQLVIKISSTNPHFILMDFNTKSSNWSSNDLTTAEEAQLDY